MTDIKALHAAIAAVKEPIFLAPDSVENHDGLAVFKRNGNVVGWMNWDDFNALCDEQDALKDQADATVQKGKT